jgi:hypothetical protein
LAIKSKNGFDGKLKTEGTPGEIPHSDVPREVRLPAVSGPNASVPVDCFLKKDALAHQERSVSSHSKKID